MSAHVPVTTLQDLATLDEVEMIEGYRDGFAGEPEPGGNRTRSHWHGWRNGAVDGGHRSIDQHQVDLAYLVVAEQRRPA